MKNWIKQQIKKTGIIFESPSKRMAIKIRGSKSSRRRFVATRDFAARRDDDLNPRKIMMVIRDTVRDMERLHPTGTPVRVKTINSKAEILGRYDPIGHAIEINRHYLRDDRESLSDWRAAAMHEYRHHMQHVKSPFDETSYSTLVGYASHERDANQWSLGQLLEHYVGEGDDVTSVVEKAIKTDEEYAADFVRVYGPDKVIPPTGQI